MTWDPYPELDPPPTIELEGRLLIYFKDKYDDYGWLGNMSHLPVCYQGQTFKSSEHLFQWLRYDGHPRIQKRIFDHPNSLFMKKVVHRKSEHLITPLNPVQDRERMLVALRAKVETHPELGQRLLRTKDAILVEDVSSRPKGSGMVWGAAWNPTARKWFGHNWLGKSWMRLRDEIGGADLQPAPVGSACV